MDCQRKRYGEGFCHGACREFEIAVVASMSLLDRENSGFHERFKELYESSRALSGLERTAYFWDQFAQIMEEMPSVSKLRDFEYSENAYLEEILRRYVEKGNERMVSWASSVY